ncbi:hypothetical protein BDW74DRAFT_167098 [Aspergillus multicolor]|uniref:uncharacterized protein n=1 Tax=Aspergillus multicolor TaxID=41759 RepID=UPI003CCCF998
MKYLTAEERKDLLGDYFAPEGLYEYTKGLPFVGRVTRNVSSIVAGKWTEILLDYEVGASGLADGAWIQGTFKFYSDWALFQTSDKTKDNHVSAEYVPNKLFPGQTPATVESLSIRFDQKGHERPFQKAVIVDIHDGYLNPGDKITFVEKDFRWRFYIDPVGTSRFAPIQPDIPWDIVAGPVHRVQTVSPRLVRPDVPFAIHAHAEDIWGNVTRDLTGFVFKLRVFSESTAVIEQEAAVPEQGWTNAIFSELTLATDGEYTIHVSIAAEDGSTIASSLTHLTVSSNLSVPKILYGDLHVHSDDTVGTESSSYSFSYGRDIAALDVLGYTANDFQITQKDWDETNRLIKSLNEPGGFVIFPGTEWCGNSAAGGDHNVVFLGDPETQTPEFPFNRHGNVARSFEWSEHGPKDLVPGAWPLDEVYATNAADAETHLLVPHVGGRRCNLAWHHPKLERLVEIGSAWGQFEWLLQDAVRRAWKLGVCANSDEHRGRCGGGVPGTAVFGTRGGLTGILAPTLTRGDVAKTLRARRTFATTGQRLVGLLSTADGSAQQGDEITVPRTEHVQLKYHFLGDRGFSTIEAFDASGLIWSRHFWSESQAPATIVRVTWGGARVYDRYREAIWNGTITLSDMVSSIKRVVPFGGLADNPEDYAKETDSRTVSFNSRTSGDIDGVHILLDDAGSSQPTVTITGCIGGYVKVGDALAGNPHKAQPTFKLKVSWEEALQPGGKDIEIRGGADLFIRVEAIPDIDLPRRVEGTLTLGETTETVRAVYFVGTEWSGAKVVTSPIFISPI